MTTNQATNLFLIGFRGSGKTTIGPAVANLLQTEFIDLDDWIQTKENKTIAQIFSEFGENHFRQLERKYLVQVAQFQNTVISCGGGIVLNSENRECLKNSAKCVWLKASASFLMKRIESDPATARTRPKLTQFGGLPEIEQLLAEREPLYADCADYSIWVENRTVDDLASEIANWWRKDDK
jgi:shikimate kinase